MTLKKLRWGILGSAAIAKRAVIPGIQGSDRNEVAAIASRDLKKSKDVAKQFGIANAYGSYEELLADDTIDAVYIPLPNHLHLEWTLKAAEAGKHILCEKPLALTSGEAQQMADACQRAGVQLAEAFMYRWHPRYNEIASIIASGEIGEVRSISSSFTFNNAGDSGNVRYRKEWGGGSLYDVGCYPISAARLLLGQEPVAATAHAMFSPQHDDVDMMLSGLLEFEGGKSLIFDCGMWAAFRNPLEVLGTDGIIQVPHAYVTNSPGSANFFVHRGGETREVQIADINAYTAQADAMHSVITGNVPLRFGPNDSVHNMKVIEACLRSARERTRIAL